MLFTFRRKPNRVSNVRSSIPREVYTRDESQARYRPGTMQLAKCQETLLIIYCRRRRHSSDEYARLMIESLTGFRPE